MPVSRRLTSIALLPGLLLLCAPARAQNAPSWDGIWTGVERKIGEAPIQIAIVDGKVISYTLKGAPFAIAYSAVSPTAVTFGDRNHYFVKLDRTGETTATGQFQDRSGAGALTLTREMRASGVDAVQPARAERPSSTRQ